MILVSNINDVAKQAGVAVSTVSKVLNDYPNVSEATKKKVMKVIHELDYVPNAVASALSSKKYDKVALIININNQRQAIDEINMQYLFGAISKAKKMNINILTIFSTMLSDLTSEEIIRDLKAQGVNGILIYGLTKQHLTMQKVVDSKAFKAVLVDAPLVNEVTTSVMVDHKKAQYDVAKKTIEGEYCKKVLYLAGGENGYVTDMRIAGIKQLKKELGFKLRLLYADFSEKKARAYTLRFGDEADVIVCASDLMAIGAKNALKEMNIFRPVCGYDGITLMGYAGEQMNTVRQDFYHVSEIAIEEMGKLLKGGVGKKVLLNYDITKLYYLDIIT